MKINILFSAISILFLAFSSQNDKGYLDEQEARLMFDYLQDLRQKKVDRFDPLLKYVDKGSLLLNWNDTLAKVAQARAMDMAVHNYFDHIDRKGYGVNYYIAEAGYELESEWTEKKDYNFFESLEAGKENYKEIISDLIIDQGVPNKGHRKHLLGLDEWNKKNVDVGIAVYRVGSNEKATYSTYTVIIIARHKW
jgi:uncharacterized protein YkwD